MLKRKVEGQVERQELQNIMALDCPKRVKIALIENKISILKPIVDVYINRQYKKQQNISTSITENQSNFLYYQLSIEELEENIIQKRLIKFKINEQIEKVQEEVLHLEEIAEASMNYDHSLIKEIDYHIQKNRKFQQNNQLQGRNQTYLNKSIKKFTSIFKNLFK